MKHIKQILVIVIPVILLLFYPLYQQFLSKKEIPTLPYYTLNTSKQVYEGRIEKTDSSICSQQTFCATSQQNKIFCSNELQGKVHIVCFFFTACQGICKDMTRELSRLHRIYEKNASVTLLSITSDPEDDTPEALMEYATLHRVTAHERWVFLTAPRDSLYELAKYQYYLLNPDDSDATQFIHTERAALLDKNGCVRGFYDATSEKDVTKLIKDVRTLLEN